MKQLTEKIVENWRTYTVNRRYIWWRGKEKLLEMYKYFEDRMSMALGVEAAILRHGRWLCRTLLHVTDTYSNQKLLESNGSMISFTDEDWYSYVNNDLGKVGDLDKDYYIPQDPNGSRISEIFKHNLIWYIDYR